MYVMYDVTSLRERERRNICHSLSRISPRIAFRRDMNARLSGNLASFLPRLC